MKNKTIPVLILIVLGFFGLVFGLRLFTNKQMENLSNNALKTNLTGKPNKTTPTLPADANKKSLKAPKLLLKDGYDYKAKIRTNKGVITIDLYEELTPITVNNFVYLANEGFYDQVTFHRVIADFMIQGGDPTGTGRGGPGYAIPDEHIEGSTNIKGTISMANSGPNSGGSQFFINVVDNVRLDWDKPPLTSKHPAFGIVIEGIDVVEAISKSKTDASDKPTSPIIIETVEIIEEQK